MKVARAQKGGRIHSPRVVMSGDAVHEGGEWMQMVLAQAPGSKICQPESDQPESNRRVGPTWGAYQMHLLQNASVAPFSARHRSRAAIDTLQCTADSTRNALLDRPHTNCRYVFSVDPLISPHCIIPTFPARAASDIGSHA